MAIVTCFDTYLKFANNKYLKTYIQLTYVNFNDHLS